MRTQIRPLAQSDINEYVMGKVNMLGLRTKAINLVSAFLKWGIRFFGRGRADQISARLSQQLAAVVDRAAIASVAGAS